MALKTAAFYMLLVIVAQTAVAQSDVLSKKVSLDYENMPLKAILSDLQHRYKLNFTYFNNIPEARHITLSTKKEALGKSLATLFQKAGLKYAVTENSVVIQKKFNQLKISGKITDKETGDPLAYATVSIKEKSIGMVTNPNGEFGFLIPETYSGDTLFFSMLGYQNYEIDLSKLSEDSDLSIVLAPKQTYLEAVDVFSDNVYVHTLNPQQKPVKEKGWGLFKSYASYVHYSLDASNLSAFLIDCGAGELNIRPNTQSNEIEVDAEIITTSISASMSQQFIDDFLRLYVEEDEDTARLRSFFFLEKRDINGRKKSVKGSPITTPISKINLSIKIPPQLFVSIDDNSGGVVIEKLQNGIQLRDGSGSVSIEQVEGDVLVKDGSGGVDIQNITGNVTIVDASGEINLESVKGSVHIKDRSGGILLKKIDAESSAKNSIYIRDQSGKIEGSDMKGTVEVLDASGGIDLHEVTGKLTVKDKSGGISVSKFEGKHQIRPKSGKAVVNGKNLKKD